MQYLRFATDIFDDDIGPYIGVFQAAYRLKNCGELDDRSAPMLVDLLDWFAQNLHAPLLYQADWRALFWFRSDSHEAIERAWAMTVLLQDNGVAVEQFVSSNPGTICYRDQHQVAAIPDRSTDPATHAMFGLRC